MRNLGWPESVRRAYALPGRPREQDLIAVVSDILEFTARAFNFRDPAEVNFATMYMRSAVGLTSYRQVDNVYVREYRAHVRSEFGPDEVLRRTRILAWLLWSLVRLELLEKNPIWFVLRFTRRRYGSRPIPKERVIPTVEEAARIRMELDAMSSNGEPWCLLFDFLVETGVRVSEALGVTRRAVNGRGVVFPRRKNHRALYRELSPELGADLKSHLERLPDSAETIWLHKGNPVSWAMWHKALTRATQRARIAKRITSHALRHYFATRLLANGGSIFEAQQLLGHDSLGATLIYAHIPDTRLEEALKSETVEAAARRAAMFVASARS